jgi:hypothetical protein
LKVPFLPRSPSTRVSSVLESSAAPQARLSTPARRRRSEHNASHRSHSVLSGNELYGAPGEIRTPDLMLRRHSLYPAELRAHSLRIPHLGIAASERSDRLIQLNFYRLIMLKTRCAICEIGLLGVQCLRGYARTKGAIDAKEKLSKSKKSRARTTTRHDVNGTWFPRLDQYAAPDRSLPKFNRRNHRTMNVI